MEEEFANMQNKLFADYPEEEDEMLYKPLE